MKRRAFLSIGASSIVAVAAVALVFGLLTSPAAASPGDTTADLVLGQGGSFTSQTCALSATALCTPDGVAVDSNGNVYVAELQNNRVLEFDNPLGSCGSCDMTADRVFGQGGSFTSSACNLGGISASSLCQPADVAVDSNNNVYVVDFGNNRVLEYLNPIGTDTIADRVFGQGGSFITGTYTLTPTANTLTNPISVVVDATDHVYIGDRGMHRVLEYDPPFSNTTANRVFGQFGSFTTGTYNNGGTSADSLTDILGLGIDASGDLYVTDQGNARVLEYTTPISTDTTADLVFGQFGSFTSGVANNGGVNADSLWTPTDVGVDSAGNVYISDTGTERTLEYDNPLGLGTTADVVFGQGGSFIASGNNSGGLSANSQADPWAIAFGPNCSLWLADYGNNRVLEYDQPPHACVNPGTATPTSTICPVGPCTATPTITDTATPTATPTGCIPNPVQGCPTPTPTCSPVVPCNSPTDTPTVCVSSAGLACTPTPTATATPCVSTSGVACTATPTPTSTPCISSTGAACTPTATSTPTPTPTCTPTGGVPCPTPTSTPCISSSGAACTPTPTPTCTPAGGVPCPTATPPPTMCDGFPATIVGTAGNDLIFGTGGNDVIAGLGGNDVIFGMGGNDIICGDAGNDVIYGGAGRDLIFGGTGNDVIFAGAGPDFIDGGPGFDFCDGGPPALGDVAINCEIVTGVP